MTGAKSESLGTGWHGVGLLRSSPGRPAALVPRAATRPPRPTAGLSHGFDPPDRVMLGQGRNGATGEEGAEVRTRSRLRLTDRYVRVASENGRK